MPRVTIRSDSGEQISHDLVDETVTIGRSAENFIRLDDISVSDRHAELIIANERCYLKDLGSTNGTLVNEEPITGVQLRPGDRIRFGKVEAWYEGDVASDAQPLPRLEAVEARPAEASAPRGFRKCVPLPSRRKEKNPMRIVVLAAAALAFLAFLGSMIDVFMIRGPMP
ncbi:MAG TPA: FHA domain-containing protein [Chthoniobacterales bacterium]